MSAEDDNLLAGRWHVGRAWLNSLCGPDLEILLGTYSAVGVLVVSSGRAGGQWGHSKQCVSTDSTVQYAHQQQYSVQYMYIVSLLLLCMVGAGIRTDRFSPYEKNRGFLGIGIAYVPLVFQCRCCTQYVR